MSSSEKGSIDNGIESGTVSVEEYVPTFYADESYKYVEEKGGNNAPPTYQNADGAPVETHSPLGYNVGPLTALFLNITMLIGTGIFSTPSNVLKGTGSVGLALIYWVIGLVISLAGISVYLELLSFFPSRSGAEVVYLEQAFPRPKHFFPVAFAAQTIILSFISSNAIVLAGYIFKLADHSPSAWQLKGLAIGGLTVIAAIVLINTKLSLRLVTVLGFVKLGTLLFIIIAGFVVLGGGAKHKVADPHANFRNAFEGTSSDGYYLSNALVSIIFSYGGFTNSFNVANEVKNPIKTIKYTANTAVIVVGILYVLTNIAYFAALPKADIIASSQTTATLFFSKLFGKRAATGLTILPVLSAGSNILAVIIGQTRAIREVGRQGVLPFQNFWVSTKPFGTPLGPVAVIWLVSVIMILAPPAGDAFNFIISLQNYPESFFLALVTVGLFLIRRQRKRLSLPASGYRGWSFVAVFFLLSKVYLLVMPWVPPKGGVNNSSFHFFYAASSLTGLGIIGLSGVYYYVWAKLLPKIGKYQIRSRIRTGDDGSAAHEIVKVPNDEVEEWDAVHDPSGRSINENQLRLE